MAGMLASLEMARRRKASHHHNHQIDPSHHQRFDPYAPHQRIEPPSSMNEAALLARKRLEEKLRGFCAPSSSNRKRKQQQSSKEEKQSNYVAYLNATDHTSTSRKGEQSLQLDRWNSQREVCAICLDGFDAQQQVMNLPCFHKYHSSCLLPWLSTHSHCPYCRTNVMSIAK